MRVLVVKTTSLGDIIHTLPALTDAVAKVPGITFDWVVEEPFQEIPLWHPAVKKVIPVAFRRWRKQGWWQNRREIIEFCRRLREEEYDLIIDAQGLLKSAIITIMAKGTKRAGLSWKSARESLASLFYNYHAIVPWGQHAVYRVRALFARTFNYLLPNSFADYGIDINRLSATTLLEPYFVFLHGTTWDTKHWPEAYWIQLAKIVSEAGFSIQLLWGNEIEFTRAKKIASGLPNAFVVPNRLSLTEAAGVLAGARGVVTVDTGLGHLAAALGVPAVALFGPSNPRKSGTLGKRQIHLSATFPCSPCYDRVCRYRGEKPVDPPCFASLSPTLVWEKLNFQLDKAVE